ncbi:MAG TPA: transcriptional regulator [Alphaproteobacteria bacterium]|nr:transcriptional regulator [Alphaproteobacteria bacterium]
MANSWTKTKAKERIEKSLTDVQSPTIKDYVRDTSLDNIPNGVAYKVDGVHLYVDIVNMAALLAGTDKEGETIHQRVLRFMELHYRAVARILNECDVVRVDFANQRLHAVVTKPYDDEAKRIKRAVAIAQLIQDVVAQTGDSDDNIPDAQVRVGIDSGVALAVNNGRRGAREPLFLGVPANVAAKHAAGTKLGIFVTANARAAAGFAKVDDTKATALSAVDIAAAQESAQLGTDASAIVEKWRDDLKKNPLGRFEFSGQTPPLANMPIDELSPSNCKRQDLTVLFADIDRFSAFVADRIAAAPKDVVQVLHVLRSELDAVLRLDFQGFKLRFIGDCILGLSCDGTAQTTDAPLTVANVTIIAAALHSSFEMCLEVLEAKGIDLDIDDTTLGLAVGFELGPVATTRLGLKGDLIPCSVGRSVVGAEAEQNRCASDVTAIGPQAFAAASDAVKGLFDASRKAKSLRYADVVEALAERDERAAKVVFAPALARSPLQTAAAQSSPRSYCGS